MSKTEIVNWVIWFRYRSIITNIFLDYEVSIAIISYQLPLKNPAHQWQSSYLDLFQFIFIECIDSNLPNVINSICILKFQFYDSCDVFPKFRKYIYSDFFHPFYQLSISVFFRIFVAAMLSKSTWYESISITKIATGVEIQIYSMLIV